MTKKLFLNKINIQNDIGIVGGGKFEKILEQTAGVKLFSKIYFLIYICENYYFSESDSVYRDYNLNLIYKKNIRNHSLYQIINILIKKTLNYLSQVHYELTGNFIDLRNDHISANHSEREHFININKINNYRIKLLDILYQLDILDQLAIELFLFFSFYILFSYNILFFFLFYIFSLFSYLLFV